MPEISQFTVPVTENGVTTNVTYHFKDSTARSSSGGKGASGTGTNAEIFNDYTNNTANGEYSHAEGATTTASGNNSHAEGGSTTASGNNSHAEGRGTKASSTNQHVQGIFNVEDSNGKYAFIIGNGTSDSARSNAFAIDWNGLIYVNNVATGVNVATLAANLANKVDKETGKGLSTEDFTTAEKTKLAGLSNYDDTVLSGRVTDLETTVGDINTVLESVLGEEEEGE